MTLELDYVRIHVRSGHALHQALLALTTLRRPYVMADPGYEPSPLHRSAQPPCREATLCEIK